VRVPATSANLGPGFDALGLALGLHDEVSAEIADPGSVGPGGVAIEVQGEGAGDVPRDGRHLVVRAMTTAYAALGQSLPPVRLRCTNRIPHGRGLGSSAAAVVAGLLLARELAGAHETLDADALLELATGLEGHPDNVAPCLLGGFTVAWTDGRAHALRLDPHPSLAAVAFVPDAPVATTYARQLLPATVPHADAARNAGRAALLVAALTQAPALLLPATEDALHQGYRRPAMPASADLVDALRADGIPAVISGAGPTVLALVSGTEATDVTAHAAGAGFRAVSLPLLRTGASAQLSPDREEPARREANTGPIAL
jgi:homoserine kinase